MTTLYILFGSSEPFWEVRNFFNKKLTFFVKKNFVVWKKVTTFVIRNENDTKTESDMETKVTRKVGDIHPNGKWAWTEYRPGKFDWRTIKGNAPKVAEEPKKKVRKLTPVQKQVMARFERGEKLVCLETNRMSGEVYFWCRQNGSGEWCATEKALYPQLRRLFLG